MRALAARALRYLFVDGGSVLVSKPDVDIQIADGVLLGGPGGRLYAVFAPRWWQLWRWVAYARAERGRVEIGGVAIRVVRSQARARIERAEDVFRR